MKSILWLTLYTISRARRDVFLYFCIFKIATLIDTIQTEIFNLKPIRATIFQFYRKKHDLWIKLSSQNLTLQ